MIYCYACYFDHYTLQNRMVFFPMFIEYIIKYHSSKKYYILTITITYYNIASLTIQLLLGINSHELMA